MREVLQGTVGALWWALLRPGATIRVAGEDVPARAVAFFADDVRGLVAALVATADLRELPVAEPAGSVEQALERRFRFPSPRSSAPGPRSSPSWRRTRSAPSPPPPPPATSPPPPPPRYRAAVVEVLRTTDPRDDEYAVDGRELYLWCPHGQLDSPLSAALAEHRGGPAGTAELADRGRARGPAAGLSLTRR